METKILNGKVVRNYIYEKLHDRIERLKKANIVPHLVMIQVGQNVASSAYLKHKKIACKKLGITSTILQLNSEIKFNELASIIEKNNNDQKVHGILVQFPLPKQLSQEKVLSLINPKKDVDGLTPLNQGINFLNLNSFAPKSCTPHGIIKMFDFYDINLEGQKVVILGRSNIVGKPLFSMLINRNAVVTNLHTKVKPEDIKEYIKNADIIISAAGVTDLFSPTMVKEGVIIFDVGIHRDENNILRGDLDYRQFLKIASWITPVPGGVGPMTVAMLMENVVYLAENTIK